MADEETYYFLPQGIADGDDDDFAGRVLNPSGPSFPARSQHLRSPVIAPRSGLSPIGPRAFRGGESGAARSAASWRSAPQNPASYGFNSVKSFERRQPLTTSAGPGSLAVGDNFSVRRNPGFYGRAVEDLPRTGADRLYGGAKSYFFGEHADSKGSTYDALSGFGPALGFDSGETDSHDVFVKPLSPEAFPALGSTLDKEDRAAFDQSKSFYPSLMPPPSAPAPLLHAPRSYAKSAAKPLINSFASTKVEVWPRVNDVRRNGSISSTSTSSASVTPVAPKPVVKKPAAAAGRSTTNKSRANSTSEDSSPAVTPSPSPSPPTVPAAAAAGVIPRPAPLPASVLTATRPSGVTVHSLTSASTAGVTTKPKSKAQKEENHTASTTTTSKKERKPRSSSVVDREASVTPPMERESEPERSPSPPAEVETASASSVATTPHASVSVSGSASGTSATSSRSKKKRKHKDSHHAVPAAEKEASLDTSAAAETSGEAEAVDVEHTTGSAEGGAAAEGSADVSMSTARSELSPSPELEVEQASETPGEDPAGDFETEPGTGPSLAGAHDHDQGQADDADEDEEPESSDLNDFEPESETDSESDMDVSQPLTKARAVQAALERDEDEDTLPLPSSRDTTRVVAFITALGHTVVARANCSRAWMRLFRFIALALAMLWGTLCAIGRVHRQAASILTLDHQLTSCFLFLYIYPYLSLFMSNWAPPSVLPCLWYAFLMHTFCSQGTSPAFLSPLMRVLLPVILITCGTSHHTLLTDLNGSERLAGALILSAFRNQQYLRPMFLLCISFAIILAITCGAHGFVQWLILFLSIFAINTDEKDRFGLTRGRKVLAAFQQAAFQPSPPAHSASTNQHMHPGAGTLSSAGFGGLSGPRRRLTKQLPRRAGRRVPA